MRASGAEILEHEIRIAATPETVFSYFTDSDKMRRWKGIQANLDPRPGGVYHVNINGRDIARGEYLEVVPFSRIVFTWGWEGSPLPPGSTTVEVTLTPEAGCTVVRLRHMGLPPDQRPIHVDGWDHYLPRWQTAAEGRDPGLDPWTEPRNT